MPDKLAKVHAHITTSQLIFAAVLLGMATPFLLLSGAQATPLNTDSLSVKKSTLAQASKKDTNSSVRQLKGSVNADTFSTNSTPPNLTKSSKADTKAVETWFEKYDNLKDKYYPSPADKVLLGRPMMQEEERVKQWIVVASKVSHNYTLLAKALKTLPLPESAPEIRRYRDLTADWYQDTAQIFDDLVRPRAPAKTIEELQGNLREIKTRSRALSDTATNLSNMDQDIRKQYGVHPDLHTDSFQQYVRSN